MPRVPKKYLRHFIRGYFDGDGCANIEHKNDSSEKPRPKRLRTSFTSGSKSFLEQLSSDLTKHAHTSNSLVHSSHRSYQLSYSTADSSLLFKFLYRDLKEPLYLFRKFATFKQYFTLRPEKVDLGIEQILHKA